MHAENELLPSQRIKGLKVSDVMHSKVIQLPTSFSCIAIPARRQQIPCPEMAKKWPHLRDIASHLIHPQNDIEVGLLIGSNCPQAIIPREVIPGQQNEPYAQRSDLGWGIIGNVTKPTENNDESSVAIVHRVTTRNPTSTNTPQQKTCYFAIKPTVKEVINPAQLCQMLELDFSERRNSEPSMSQDDKKFLSKMDQGAYQEEGGHYVMPLPFRELVPKMPNNNNDPEVKTNVLVTQVTSRSFSTIPERLEYFSDWHRAKRAVAVIVRFQRRWKRSHLRPDEAPMSSTTEYQRSNVEELLQAEVAIVKQVQEQAFSKEIQTLRSMQKPDSGQDDVRRRKAVMKKTSSLYRLDPFLDKEGVLRVGGRLTRANTPSC
ncbi:Hypothetical predicted protein [Paramuricea clavata]|uniref:Uncharacterized protein n=1 Tax=Paramuricea clavata TaxID=317549 RepID=A0A6S7I653_PARCT|nr:Hypothetical predicted protein [Paramuricea clavata]